MQNAFAFVIHEPEIGLGASVSLIGGEAEPAHGFGIVLRDTDADLVHQPEADLRVGMPLVGGEAIPPSCLRGGVAQRDALDATNIRLSKLVLGFGVPLLSSQAEGLKLPFLCLTLLGVRCLGVLPGVEGLAEE